MSGFSGLPRFTLPSQCVSEQVALRGVRCGWSRAGIGVMLMLAAIGFTVVSGLLLVWMLVLTRHAWRTLPPGAQVPVHGGLGGWDRWRPRESALLIWPVFAGVIWLVNLGIVIYAVAVAAGRSTDSTAVVLAVCIAPMVILLVSERLALKAADRRAASDAGTSA